MAAGLLVAAIAAAACSDSQTPEADAAARDGGRRDSGTAPVDGAIRDAARPDATLPDATTGDAGSTPVERSCAVDADCQLINDCCTCQAASVGAVAPACDEACVQGRCDAAGISGFQCRGGRCIPNPVSCDTSTVTCRAAPPVCPAGSVPHVQGNCYSFLCVPIEACQTVPSCDNCPDDQACVTNQTQLGLRFACTPLPASCGGVASCGCVGDQVCRRPFVCTGSSGLTCTCPVC